MKSLFVILSVFLSSLGSFAQWIQTSYPVGGQINSITVKGDKLFVGNNGSGVYVSNDYGETWTPVNDGFITNPSVQDIITNGTDLFTGTYRDGVYKFSESSSSWATINNGLTDLQVYSLTSVSNYLFAGMSGDGIFCSSDNGENWSACGLPEKTIWDLSSDGNNIYAATALDGLHYSADFGSSWNKLAGLSSWSILAIEANNNILFAGTAYDGIWISTNMGETWIESNNGYPNDDTWCFAFFDSKILAGGSQGVFISMDQGASWSDISDGITDYFITAISIHDNYAFAGTSGNGILYKRLIDEIAEVRDSNYPFANGLLLNLNSPNPFSNMAWFDYRIPVSGLVSVKIVDALGREVATIVHEPKNPGTYSTYWNAAGNQAGVYFCRLELSGFVVVRKLIKTR